MLGKKPGWSSFNLQVFGVSILILLLFWDIGNILAPRQGTESLYVQISKEMFESGSFVTPLYTGTAHWSKPPLQFWIPMPLYAFFGGFSLHLARVSMGVLSIFTLIGLTRFLRRQDIQVDLIIISAIFLSSFGTPVNKNK